LFGAAGCCLFVFFDTQDFGADQVSTPMVRWWCLLRKVGLSQVLLSGSQQKKQALFFFVCLFLVAVDVVVVLRW